MGFQRKIKNKLDLMERWKGQPEIEEKKKPT